VFTNRAGLRLFGILHTPAAARSDIAVILLSPGVKMRVGPQRLYRRLTNTLTAQGVTVLRFDFFGLGDSEGALTEDLLRDVYNHIEVGRFVDDTIDAMNWMEEHCGLHRFILSGLCGGAITGLLAGAQDPRVAGLLALGITPVLASRSADPSLYMTKGQLEQIGRSYIEKLLQPGAWLRLLTLQTDFRLLWRSLKSLRRRSRPNVAQAAAPPEGDNASPLFPPAFFRMLETRRPMLLVFGGSDRLHFEFEEKFFARHRQKLAELPPLYDVHVIANANHVLSLDAWQQEMLTMATGWLDTHFPGAERIPSGLVAATT
jgi:fermentation-respiration switch protein FrsA (DUF1100 family)